MYKIKIAEGAVKDTNTPTPNKNEETEIKQDDICRLYKTKCNISIFSIKYKL